ncbi:MAG: Hsp20/alpha crystallin family protein, partial [Brevinematia bacterium]
LTDKIVILVELPGVKKEDIDITLKEGILRISGVRKELNFENRVKIYRMEMNYGYFEKVIEVGDVNEEAISAELRDGILIINIQKSF